MPDPYRDELLALREENARLRRALLERRRAGSAVAYVVGAVLITIVGLQALRPLLNAPNDATFWLGVLGVVVVVAVDVACVLAIVGRGVGRGVGRVVARRPPPGEP